MLSADQFLGFSLGAFALVALVPLAVWLATGSRVQAQRAARGYGKLLSALIGLLAAGAVFGFIAAAISS